MLIFRRQHMIGDAEQPLDRNAYSRFLIRFANCAILHCLEKIDLAAQNAPASRLGRHCAPRQQNAFALIDQQDPRADARLQYGCSV